MQPTCCLSTDIHPYHNTSQRSRENIEAFEMQCYRKVLRITYTDHVSNEEVLGRTSTRRLLLVKVKHHKVACFSHVLRHPSLEKDNDWSHARSTTPRKKKMAMPRRPDIVDRAHAARAGEVGRESCCMEEICSLSCPRSSPSTVPTMTKLMPLWMFNNMSPICSLIESILQIIQILNTSSESELSTVCLRDCVKRTHNFMTEMLTEYQSYTMANL